ncbi:hypothetical protein [Desulfobacter latus]|uniref:Lipoprotein n=1 Tax=Desulfobacter latus TaxID=2292 RepID=A0A850T2M1_9BACT|nr:hypothetical protein [Desulfobacter latus]NWH05973.1 hypothetical protein [Desulfobacter latus]
MVRYLLTCLLIGIVFVGCSQVPKPVSFQATRQKKMQASEHWNIFAKDISNAVMAEIHKKGYIDGSITFIPNDNSNFCRIFRSFLGTQFLHRGLQLKSIDDAEYQIDWSVQLVQHDSSRVPPKLPSSTMIASLGSGVYKLFEDSSAYAGTIAAAASLDIIEHVYHNDSVKLPHNEVIINVSLKKSGNLIHRSSNLYYVNDLDTWHYHVSKDNLGIDKAFSQKTYKISN